jgi:hypothetical protein
MRWIAAPLVAAFMFTGAGFVSSLARTTDVSAELTASTEKVPQTTRRAAADAAEVPVIARLTGRQAASFADLVEALRATGERVKGLEEELSRQVDGTARLRRGVAGMLPVLDCSERLLTRLVRASREVPGLLREVEVSVEDLNGSQKKSLRHLRSINRKLSALGAIADARGIDPAEPPPSVQIPKSALGATGRARCGGQLASMATYG